ncbi:MAG: hypothetical protein HZB38_19420 [Planctomycetes bacterium]|nr:hypothetical protein [Planctomycetota bacterium]
MRTCFIVLLLALAASARARTELPPPEGLPSDTSIWPNRESWRNSDEWLWRNHERIRKMQPRVIVLNFANSLSPEEVRKTHTDPLIKALAEATRYHGYDDPAAPAFLDYQLLKVIDLRDEDAKAAPRRESSSLMPKKTDGNPNEPLIDYAVLFSDEFAKHYGFPDPRKPDRFLNLGELINAGYVHELWFYAIHDPGNRWPGRETCEMKQYYDEHCRPIAGKHGMAGNGEDSTFPWVGRSFRIAFFNPHRGPGCSIENFGHTMEWIANSRSNLYYRKYFYEFADFELDRKFSLPFSSFYELSYDRKSGDKIEFPTPSRLEGEWRGKPFRVEKYCATGGSVHFPPGARHHYDLESPFSVMSTIEHYRKRKDPKAPDEASPFSREKFARYKDVAPDCMGQWIVYWFQSFPGAESGCIDAGGKPMKCWWPFLFY